MNATILYKFLGVLEYTVETLRNILGPFEELWSIMPTDRRTDRETTFSHKGRRHGKTYNKYNTYNTIHTIHTEIVLIGSSLGGHGLRTFKYIISNCCNN